MNVIEQIEAEHAAKLPGAKMPAFQPGDTVRLIPELPA